MTSREVNTATQPADALSAEGSKMPEVLGTGDEMLSPVH